MIKMILRTILIVVVIVTVIVINLCNIVSQSLAKHHWMRTNIDAVVCSCCQILPPEIMMIFMTDILISIINLFIFKYSLPDIIMYIVKYSQLGLDHHCHILLLT